MTTTTDLAKAIRKFRETKLKESQKQFAERLGVKAPTVAGWEGGTEKYSPSAESLLMIATTAVKAGLHTEALYFWNKAGIDVHAMTSGVEKILRERGVLIEGGEMIRVPRVRVSKLGRFDDLGLEVPLPKFVVPNPGSTVILDMRGTILGGGFIVDTSVTDLHSLWGDVVLVDFSKLDRRVTNPNLPSGHFAGILAKNFYQYDWGFQWLAELMSLSGGWAHQAPVYIAQWAIPFPAAGLKPSRQGLTPAQVAKLQKQTSGRLAKNLRLLPGCRIIGRVFGWLWPPREKK